MAVPDTVEYQEIKSAIQKAELDLTDCVNEDYLPQLTRQCVWFLAEMGDRLYNDGLISDALNYYIQAIKKDCDEPSVLNQIGVCLIFLDKIERALYYFELLYRRSTELPDKALALFNMAVCYKLMANFNEAIKLLRKSTKYTECESMLSDIDNLMNSVKELNSRQAFRGFMGKVFDRALVPTTADSQYSPTNDPEDSNKFTR